MRFFPLACWVLILGAEVGPEPPGWEVVRSKDGDFAFSMPAKATLESRAVQGSVGMLEILTYSCQINGCNYLVERTRSSQAVEPGRVIDELARLKDRYLMEEGARLVKETKIVVDGVIGDDFTVGVPAASGDGGLSKRIRHFLTGHYYYVLTVTPAAGQPLPKDAPRFLASLTFEAVVKAHHARMQVDSKPAAKPRANAQRATGQPLGRAPITQTKVELADSTPEDAMKTFLLALAARDEATLRAVTIPDDEFDWLLKGPRVSPELIARMKTRLEEKPMKRLKAGDPVKMSNGEARVIKPIDVREGRVVLWPEGTPLPSRVEYLGGHWKVFAKPFIAARKSADARLPPLRPKSVVNPRGPAS
jgi:hypothetical protein